MLKHWPLTRYTASLAARASISAHETVDGQAFSKAALIVSMTSNPLIEFRLGSAFFSPFRVSVSSSSTDPSHPCVMEKMKEEAHVSLIWQSI